MQELLFNTPWWLLTLLFGGGAYVWWVGNARSEKSWRTAGIVIALVGVCLLVTSFLFETDGEHVEKQTRRIVADLDHRDWDDLEKAMDARTSLEGVYTNRQQIMDGAKKTADAIGLSGVSITSMDVKETDTLITADVNILSSQDVTMGRPAVTSWRFDWENTGTGWKLVRIEPLQGSQVSREDVLKNLQKP